jgi:hypothetical protein
LPCFACSTSARFASQQFGAARADFRGHRAQARFFASVSARASSRAAARAARPSSRMYVAMSAT